jgi:hypothetical protein
MKRLRSNLTYANVMATVAVFIALGGASYAAVKLPKNSVGTKQIKKEAITGAKIKNGAVTGAKIAITSLGTVPSATTAASATTATTATTATNATNAGNAQTVGGQTPAQIVAASKLRCPSGMVLHGGTCFETSPRTAAPLTTAMDECGDLNLRLPSETELNTYIRQTGVPLPTNEWAGQIYLDNGTFRGATINQGTTAAPAFSTSQPYRCVTTPSN